MPARRRKPGLPSSALPADDPRKKKKQTNVQKYGKMVLTEIRDFILLVVGISTVFIVGSVVQIYFYNRMFFETKRIHDSHRILIINIKLNRSRNIWILSPKYTNINTMYQLCLGMYTFS